MSLLQMYKLCKHGLLFHVRDNEDKITGPDKARKLAPLDSAPVPSTLLDTSDSSSRSQASTMFSMKPAFLPPKHYCVNS